MKLLTSLTTASALVLIAGAAEAQTAPAPAAGRTTTQVPAAGTTTTQTTRSTTAPTGPQSATTSTATTTTTTAPNPAVGGAPMSATATIVANASAAPNLSTLVAAVKAADLVATLSGPGPFTVFAPTNDAFGRVAQTTRDQLMQPANKPALTKVLTYHVVPGTLTLADLKAKAASGGTLTTVEGQPLTVKVAQAAGGEAIEISDVGGNKSYVEIPDVRQSNGIVHVVNGVLFPKLS